MRLDRNLNLVVSIAREGAPDIHLHSTPLSRAAFEASFALIARTEAELFARGRAYMFHAGPQVAALTLRSVGKKEAEDAGVDGDGGAAALLAEIRRLANVVFPSPQGWQTLPVDTAIQQQILTADEWADQENAIVFFTLLSAMTKRDALPKLLTGMASFMGAQVESRNCTEFAASLPTSTPTASPPKPIQSSVPR